MSQCGCCCRETKREPECGTCPACGTDCGGDPAACASAIWTRSFFRAMRELQVEALKPKLKKVMGGKADKAADAVMESMLAMWQSTVAQSEAKETLRERLAKLYKEGR